MARPLRLEYPGALYHVSSRGDGREDVFLDAPDRDAFLGMTHDPAQWPWTSYRASAGEAPAPAWLDTGWVLGQFGQERSRARAAYRRFVGEGVGRPGPWPAIRHQIALGDAAFTAPFAAGQRQEALREVPKAQRQLVTPSLAEIQASAPDRDQAMARAYRSGVYTMKAIAEHFGVHYMTVSRAVRRVERMQAASGSSRLLDCET